MGCILFVEKFLDAVYLSTDLFSNDISLTYIFYSVDPKADVDIMYDIRDLRTEHKKYKRKGQYLHAIVCAIVFFSKKEEIKAL